MRLFLIIVVLPSSVAGAITVMMLLEFRMPAWQGRHVVVTADDIWK